MINYNNRVFKSVRNTSNGEVSAETIFHYYQENDIVWATYKGGAILFGNLIAKIDAQGCLHMRYQHINDDNDFRTGECVSKPEELEDGRLRMHETWQWTSGDYSKGTSILEEITNKD